MVKYNLIYLLCQGFAKLKFLHRIQKFKMILLLSIKEIYFNNFTSFINKFKSTYFLKLNLKSIFIREVMSSFKWMMTRTWYYWQRQGHAYNAFQKNKSFASIMTIRKPYSQPNLDNNIEAYLPLIF